jgi:hypothetical protein
MSYRDRLYDAWRKADGLVKAGERKGWPEETMRELRAKEKDAYNLVHNEELRLASDPDAPLRS